MAGHFMISEKDADEMLHEEISLKACSSKKKFDLGHSILKTLALILSWCCLGLYAEVLGPSLPTYTQMTNSNLEQIGVGLSMRELGMFFGSLVGAFMADYFVPWRHFTMAGTLVLGAVTISIVPWCTTVVTLSITFFFSGCAHGAMTANGNPLLNSIWLEKSGGPFNLMHAGYGVGAAIAPPLLAPFAIGSKKVSDNSSEREGQIIRLVFPYLCVAAICCVTACLFCFFGFCKPHQEETLEMTATKAAEGDTIDEDEGAKMKTKMPKLMQTLVAQKQVLVYIVVPAVLLYGALVGNERIFSKYLFVFANEGPAGLPKEQCFLLYTAYWIVFALARVATMFVSLVVPLSVLFAIQLVGAWAMALGLYLVPPSYAAYMAFTVCFGLFKSPLFPTGLGVINRASPVTGVITFFVNIGSSLGASAMQAIAGSLLETYGRKIFPLLVMSSGIFLIVVGFGLITVTYLYRKRYGPEPALEAQSNS